MLPENMTALAQLLDYYRVNDTNLHTAQGRIYEQLKQVALSIDEYNGNALCDSDWRNHFDD